MASNSPLQLSTIVRPPPPPPGLPIQVKRAMLKQPWSQAVKASAPSLCASKSEGESRLQPITCAADCGDASAFLQGGNCTRCACRACAHCRCTDMLGREMAPGVCSREHALRKDLKLGHFRSARECSQACNHVILGRAPPGGRPLVDEPQPQRGPGVECSAWTFANGRCVGHVDQAIFTAGWQPPGLVHGVASCAAPWSRSEASPAPSHFVLVHTVGSFACTPGVMARFARAYAQFAATTHRYAAVLVSRAPPASAPCRFYEPGYWEPGRNCSAARLAIVDEVATAFASLVRATHSSVVHKVSEETAQRALGHKMIRRMGRMHWSDRRAPIWLSAGCDLPGIVWFAQMRASGRLDASIQHVWVVQHDVGWTGELPAILARFDPAPDLLCDGPGQPSSEWPHFGEHNHLRRDRVFACLLPATRYSPRLLDDQVRGLQAGNVSYCEIRAASACAGAAWPCKAAELRGNGLLGPFSAYTSVDERALLSTAAEPSTADPFSASTGDAPIWLPERCGRARSGGPPHAGRLFHRVYDHRDKKRSRFADCPDLCYTDWPRPGRSPPPPPSYAPPLGVREGSAPSGLRSSRMKSRGGRGGRGRGGGRGRAGGGATVAQPGAEGAEGAERG
eukprot:Transcript_14011.p1 GENE.Transcript_14011~~Transcript_14011.p1  ORF type:complete len:622 (-),score=22.90 Transcript_14011:528-2393(-)